MLGNKAVVLVKSSLALTLSVIAAYTIGHVRLKSVAAQTSAHPVIYLDQAWTQADREMFYNIAQGATVVGYDIFLNLEVADSQELFRSDENSDRYGLIPQEANSRTNPDALPIGLTKTIPAGKWKDKGPQVGVTCAACHSTNISYQGKQIRIDGGVANHFDFMSYVYALDRAMQATLNNQAKFDRLAAKLDAGSSDAKTALHKRFEADAAGVHAYATRMVVSPNPYGPGRVDALSLIIDRLVSEQTGIHENWSTPIAPVKPPFLWNAPQGSWTQWGAVAEDPIARNLGETMGVYMPIDLTSKTPEDGLFSSNEQITNLITIEKALRHLSPPKWPEEVLGKIDRDKAAQGKVLFTANCELCHNAYPYRWTKASDNKYGKRFIVVGLIPEDYVGTESQLASLRPYAITGQLASYMPGPYKDQTIVPTGVMQASISAQILDKALSGQHMTDDERADMHGYRSYPDREPAPKGVYKAGPREGVWATPPYLHNGSVPNLYEMLIPAKQRTKKFYIGREFDPVKVGLDTSGKSGTFLMDTTLRGNSNQGHSFESGPRGKGVVGRLLTDDERWAIIEYLKSIPEEAGRVTQFGGPPEAASGPRKRTTP